MKRLHLFCYLVALLVSCNKTQETVKPGVDGAYKPKITRANRPQRENIPNRNDDLKDALKFALEQEVSEARDQALAEIVLNAMEYAPELAAEAFEKLPVESKERIKTIRFLADIYARKNPSEALTWAASLGSEQETRTAREVIALVIAPSDPKGAAMVLLESGKAPHVFNESAIEVLGNWAATAPTDAVAWAVKQAPGDYRRVAIYIVVSQWIQVDSRAAFSWTASLENTAVKNEAVSSISKALAEHPEPAREEFLQAAPPELRTVLEEQLEQIIPKPAEDKPVTETEVEVTIPKPEPETNPEQKQQEEMIDPEPEQDSQKEMTEPEPEEDNLDSGNATEN